MLIPYSTQSIDESDIHAVITVLRSGWITQGPCIGHFETALREYCGCQYATVVSSGTAALHLACRVANLGSGDVLWTTPNTFIASANCALYCAAQVDFVDIDPVTRNLDVALLEKKLAEAEKKRQLPKAVVVVDFAGHSCDMEKIYALCHPRNIVVIEDASHALGGFYQDGKIGSCRFSDLTILSFHPVKSITTGEGGAVLTNHREKHDRVQKLRSHGVTRDPAKLIDQRPEHCRSWYYEQQDLGFNYRLTDLQCALGVSQLKRLDGFIEKRRNLARRYHSRLANLPLKLPVEQSYAQSAWHIYAVEIDPKKTLLKREQVYSALKNAGIGVNVHYIPVHLQPYYARLGFKKGDFQNAERYYENALSLPIFPDMTKEQFETVSTALGTIFK